MGVNVNSLGFVVNSVLADLNVPATAHFAQYLHYGIKGYTEMNIMGLMPSIKTVRLKINPHTHSVKLPDDYIDYYRIAISCRSKCGYETLIDLDYNDDIRLDGEDTRLRCTPHQMQLVINDMCDKHDAAHNHDKNPCWDGRTCDNDWNTCGCGCGGSQACNDVNTNFNNTQNCNTPLPQNGCGPQDNYCNGIQMFGYPAWYWGANINGFFDYATPNFGIGPGFYRGGYRINPELRTIQFDSCVCAESIVMEYKSTGVDNMGDAWIPQDTIPALISYIHYQRCQHWRGQTLQETYLYRKDAEMHKMDWNRERENVAHRLNAMTQREYIDIIRRYTFQQPKS